MDEQEWKFKKMLDEVAKDYLDNRKISLYVFERIKVDSLEAYSKPNPPDHAADILYVGIIVREAFKNFDKFQLVYLTCQVPIEDDNFSITFKIERIENTNKWNIYIVKNNRESLMVGLFECDKGSLFISNFKKKLVPEDDGIKASLM